MFYKIFLSLCAYYAMTQYFIVFITRTFLSSDTNTRNESLFNKVRFLLHLLSKSNKTTVNLKIRRDETKQ